MNKIKMNRIKMNSNVPRDKPSIFSLVKKFALENTDVVYYSKAKNHLYIKRNFFSFT